MSGKLINDENRLEALSMIHAMLKKMRGQGFIEEYFYFKNILNLAHEYARIKEFEYSRCLLQEISMQYIDEQIEIDMQKDLKFLNDMNDLCETLTNELLSATLINNYSKDSVKA